MQFICIMGVSGSGKSTIENKLETMGFTRSISYTTREPRVRDGVAEVDGKEYRFVNKEKFLQLVDKGIIIEYEEYNGNLYGTPEPYGSTSYVAVVCLKGYRALKEKYGKQVVGIYLKCDDEIATARAKSRDSSEEFINKRKEEDRAVAIQMEQEADIVINSGGGINNTIAEILKYIKKN